MRYTTLSSISECSPSELSSEKRVDRLSRSIDEASRDDPDLICLPEALNLGNTPIQKAGLIAETLEAPYCTLAFEKSSESSE